VRLSCNQSDATFQLLTLNDQQEESGVFPDLITELPEGNYKLLSQHHGHQRQQTVSIKAGVTNENPVEFSYGAADLETTPSGASVQDSNGRQWGVTPLNLPELLPGYSQLTFRLGGYEPVTMTLEIAGRCDLIIRTRITA
jgi:PEGA domain-containing protein